MLELCATPEGKKNDPDRGTSMGDATAKIESRKRCPILPEQNGKGGQHLQSPQKKC